MTAYQSIKDKLKKKEGYKLITEQEYADAFAEVKSRIPPEKYNQLTETWCFFFWVELNKEAETKKVESIEAIRGLLDRYDEKWRKFAEKVNGQFGRMILTLPARYYVNMNAFENYVKIMGKESCGFWGLLSSWKPKARVSEEQADDKGSFYENR